MLDIRQQIRYTEIRESGQLKHMDKPVLLQADLQDAVLISGYYTKHLTDENLTLDEYLKSRLTNR